MQCESVVKAGHMKGDPQMNEWRGIARENGEAAVLFTYLGCTGTQ
jgi:hypothetical protein